MTSWVPVQAHYDHTFNVGDVVLNLGRTLGPPGEGGNSSAVPLHSVVGEVMRTANGEVHVHWVDGTESSLPPDQVRLHTHPGAPAGLRAPSVGSKSVRCIMSEHAGAALWPVFVSLIGGVTCRLLVAHWLC